MRLRGEPTDPNGGDTVGLVLWAEGSTARLLYAPGIAGITGELEAEAARASVLLVDGTCFSNEETVLLVGRTSAEMGHLAMAGEGGTLAWLGQHRRARRIYVHINNTNPVLSPHSRARREVEAGGVEIGEDGVELRVK
jgi:pyrroloquinoline quinone biosynthesis protein B